MAWVSRSGHRHVPFLIGLHHPAGGELWSGRILVPCSALADVASFHIARITAGSLLILMRLLFLVLHVLRPLSVQNDRRQPISRVHATALSVLCDM